MTTSTFVSHDPIAAAPEALRGRRAGWIDRALLPVAALLSVGALLLPWWSLTMHAPQYPDGLTVTTGLLAVTGDVNEVDGLNHYIGFMKLAGIATVERKIAPWGELAIIVLLMIAAGRRPAWTRWLALPAVVLPLFFLGDLAGWLYYAGHHLDPHAALSSSVAPWTPHLIGRGGVGQFTTIGSLIGGFWCALAAAVLAAIAIVRFGKNESESAGR